tara:strand:+ start:909 stop:1673 length:765 start_codon:yes stop_codon:yes gene_type:complete
MKKLPISVFFVTLNESAYIADAIKSVSSCDEIIVVDCGSTDGTQEIATKLGANVVHHPWQGYAKQKQFALELCQHEWVLNLDGDEVMTEDALKELESVINNPRYASFRLKRIDMFIDKFPKESVKKKNNLRAYKKSLAFFNKQKKVHESATVKGQEYYSKSHFYHFGYNNIDTLLNKINTYSSLRAQEKFESGKAYSLAKLLFAFPVFFFKDYILGRLFLFGVRGFIKAMIGASYAFAKEAKLYEMHKKGKDKS